MQLKQPPFVTQTFSLGSGSDLGWNAKIANEHSDWHGCLVYFPVIQNFKIGSVEDQHVLFSFDSVKYCIDRPDDVKLYFTRPVDPVMPIDVYNTKSDTGVYFHVLSSAFDLNFSDKDDFASKRFNLRQPAGEESELIDCRISPHKGDWHAAFYKFKEYVRSNFDFTYYKRPIQQEFRKKFLSHFTFLYGKDIYDPKTNSFRLEEFLNEGKLNFGGYDYLLLWHAYPRVGLDNRDQFDMLKDLPGGLDGLRKMVDKAHEKGVWALLPYNPWDTMNRDKEHYKEMARAVKAVGADGVFLDTMSQFEQVFRDAIDEVNPDAIFISEGRPSLKAAELLTGSWAKRPLKMPSVDLLRFVIPEHNVRNVERANRVRKNMIYNSLFNGIGLIVWEDVFGEINQFSWNERILISRYNRIVHENNDAFLTDNPVPLVASLREWLYINAFGVEDKCVYTIYQSNRHVTNRMNPPRMMGPFMEVKHPADWHYVDVWNHKTIAAEVKNGKTYLVSLQETADDMSCVVGMPENLKVVRDGDVLKIKARKPLANSTICVNTVNNLTMAEEEVLKLPGSKATVEISKLKLDFPYLVIVKLMQQDVLKDEVILNLGWKRFEPGP